MLVLIIDAVVLMVLMQALSDDSVEFLTAIIFALVASVGTFLLALGLSAALGTAGAILAAILAAAGVGVAVSAFFGVEIKRSFLIGAVFMAVHVGASFSFQMMLS